MRVFMKFLFDFMNPLSPHWLTFFGSDFHTAHKNYILLFSPAQIAIGNKTERSVVVRNEINLFSLSVGGWV